MGISSGKPSALHEIRLKKDWSIQCARAAKAIDEADVLLLATGAGWSADSGLSVYKDIAKIKAYHDKNLDYADICNPKWIEEDPALFYGFWGGCFNDYRDTEPHDGYYIIRRWVKERFSDTQMAKVLLSAMEKSGTYKEKSPFVPIPLPRAEPKAAAVRPAPSDKKTAEVKKTSQRRRSPGPKKSNKGGARNSKSKSPSGSPLQN